MLNVTLNPFLKIDLLQNKYSGLKIYMITKVKYERWTKAKIKI